MCASGCAHFFVARLACSGAGGCGGRRNGSFPHDAQVALRVCASTVHSRAIEALVSIASLSTSAVAGLSNYAAILSSSSFLSSSSRQPTRRVPLTSAHPTRSLPSGRTTTHVCAPSRGARAAAAGFGAAHLQPGVTFRDAVFVRDGFVMAEQHEMRRDRELFCRAVGGLVHVAAGEHQLRQPRLGLGAGHHLGRRHGRFSHGREQ